MSFINKTIIAVAFAVAALFISTPTSTFAACTPTKAKPCPKVVTLTPAEVALKGAQTSKPATVAATTGNVNVSVGAVKGSSVTVTFSVAGKSITMCAGSSGALKTNLIKSGAANFYGVYFEQDGNKFLAYPGACK